MSTREDPDDATTPVSLPVHIDAPGLLGTGQGEVTFRNEPSAGNLDPPIPIELVIRGLPDDIDREQVEELVQAGSITIRGSAPDLPPGPRKRCANCGAPDGWTQEEPLYRLVRFMDEATANEIKEIEQHGPLCPLCLILLCHPPQRRRTGSPLWDGGPQPMEPGEEYEERHALWQYGQQAGLTGRRREFHWRLPGDKPRRPRRNTLTDALVNTAIEECFWIHHRTPLVREVAEQLGRTPRHLPSRMKDRITAVLRTKGWA